MALIKCARQRCRTNNCLQKPFLRRPTNKSVSKKAFKNCQHLFKVPFKSCQHLFKVPYKNCQHLLKVPYKNLTFVAWNHPFLFSTESCHPCKIFVNWFWQFCDLFGISRVPRLSQLPAKALLTSCPSAKNSSQEFLFSNTDESWQ